MASFRKAGRTGRAGVDLGFVLIAAGVLVDVAYHLWWSGDEQHARLGLLGHTVTLVGMVVTMAGVVAAGLRSSSRPSPKGEPDAARRGTSAT